MSILKPTQGLEFLEFVINSINMVITINKDKSEHIILRPKKIILLFPEMRVTQKIFSRAAALFLVEKQRALSFIV